jgi:hypothetical protein
MARRRLSAVQRRHLPGAVDDAGMADHGVERIYLACQVGLVGEKRIKAILDAYNPTGSSRFVNFTTSKPTRWTTGLDHSHVNLVVCNSEWEAEFCRAAEANPHVVAYVKNQELGFEAPNRDGATPRRHLRDLSWTRMTGVPRGCMSWWRSKNIAATTRSSRRRLYARCGCLG